MNNHRVTLRPATANRALAVLPATRAELRAALGVGEAQTGNIWRLLIQHGYAEQWGDKLTEAGKLAPILRATGRVP